MEEKWTIEGDRRKRKAEQTRMVAFGLYWTACSLLSATIITWFETGRPLDCLPLVAMAIFFVLVAIFARLDGFIQYERRG